MLLRQKKNEKVLHLFTKFTFFLKARYLHYITVFLSKIFFLKYGRVLHTVTGYLNYIHQKPKSNIVLFPINPQALVLYNNVHRPQCVKGFLGGVCRLKQLGFKKAQIVFMLISRYDLRPLYAVQGRGVSGLS